MCVRPATEPVRYGGAQSMPLALTVTLFLAAQPAAAPLPFTGSGSAKTADKIALRRLLVDRRFAELTAALEGLQALSEADCAQELIGLDAFEAFYCAAPATSKLFDDWVAASPDSYAPLVARGTWRFAMAEAGRGTAFARDTSEAQWKAMAALAPQARADLEASIAKHPTFAAAAIDPTEDRSCPSR